MYLILQFQPDTPDDALRVYKRVKDGKPERILIWQLFSSGFGGFGSQWIEGNVKILAEENEEYRVCEGYAQYIL